MKALARYQIILLGEQRHIGVNNLPKVVARQCRGRESNLRSADRESGALITTPPSWRASVCASDCGALWLFVLNCASPYFVTYMLGKIVRVFSVQSGIKPTFLPIHYMAWLSRSSLVQWRKAGQLAWWRQPWLFTFWIGNESVVGGRSGSCAISQGNLLHEPTIDSNW